MLVSSFIEIPPLSIEILRQTK